MTAATDLLKELRRFAEGDESFRKAGTSHWGLGPGEAGQLVNHVDRLVAELEAAERAALGRGVTTAPRDLAEALRSLRAAASLPDTMLWGEVPIKVPQARAVVTRLDRLEADLENARGRQAALTAAAELHRPEGRDRHVVVTHDPAQAVTWWCRQCARTVKARGCATWKLAGL